MVTVPEQISTSRLIIRRIQAEDTREMFEAYGGDERVAKYMTWPVAISEDQLQVFVSSAICAWEEGTAFDFVVTDSRTGAIIGGCGMKQFERNNDRHFIFGYCLSVSVWGCGYATEISKALVEWFDNSQKVFRLGAWVDIDNPASCRVLEKAGLKQEGILRRWIVHPNLSHEPRDVFVYSKVK